MTLLPRGVKVHLAFGFIDMRKGIDGPAMLVQGVLRQDPFSGHLFVFRVGSVGFGQPRAHLPAENIWLNLGHGHGSPAERKMAMVIGRPLLKLNASTRGPRS